MPLKRITALHVSERIRCKPTMVRTIQAAVLIFQNNSFTFPNIFSNTPSRLVALQLILSKTNSPLLSAIKYVLVACLFDTVCTNIYTSDRLDQSYSYVGST